MIFTWLIWLFLNFYILVSIAGSLLPVNSQFQEPENGIEIFVASNGVHTDFVLPVKNGLYDWKEFIRDDEFKPFWKYTSHIGFGWGDQGFYLQTPEWKDLTFNTAMKAVLIPSSSAMHVTLWDRPGEHRMIKRIVITENQYNTLTSYIRNSFETGKSDKPVMISKGYGQYDLFYDGEASFHLFSTCNTWTNHGLKSAGIRACLWTFYDRAILRQISKIKD